MEQPSPPKLVISPNLKRVTGFDAQVLAAALAEDADGEVAVGILTLWGYDLIWTVHDVAEPYRTMSVMLATDWPTT